MTQIQELKEQIKEENKFLTKKERDNYLKQLFGEHREPFLFKLLIEDAIMIEKLIQLTQENVKVTVGYAKNQEIYNENIKLHLEVQKQQLNTQRELRDGIKELRDVVKEKK